MNEASHFVLVDAPCGLWARSWSTPWAEPRPGGRAAVRRLQRPDPGPGASACYRDPLPLLLESSNPGLRRSSPQKQHDSMSGPT